MLVAAVFCPATALLVPEVAAGAAAELEQARASCLKVLLAGLATNPDMVEVVAPGPSASWPPQLVNLARLGLPGPPADERPAALHVGQWLLDQAGWGGVVRARTVADREVLADLDHRVLVLALADGSARRSTAAPGHLHPDAEAYDSRLAAAVGEADTATLLSLDPADDERFLVSGRPVLQTVASAADEAGPGWAGELAWSGAPYGVGYFVALWSR